MFIYKSLFIALHSLMTTILFSSMRALGSTVKITVLVIEPRVLLGDVGVESIGALFLTQVAAFESKAQADAAKASWIAHAIAPGHWFSTC